MLTFFFFISNIASLKKKNIQGTVAHLQCTKESPKKKKKIKTEVHGKYNYQANKPKNKSKDT